MTAGVNIANFIVDTVLIYARFTQNNYDFMVNLGSIYMSYFIPSGAQSGNE